RLPLTANGKVDRRALPAPELNGPEREREYVEPRTPVEEMLAEIWAEILGLDRVGVHDDFFDLGGHSLLATQLTSRARLAFKVEVRLQWLLERPTVVAVSERIEEAIRVGHGLEVPPLKAASRDQELPLSFAQQRLWFINQLEPGNVTYNLLRMLRLSG